MSSITNDPNDPRLGRGVDESPVAQNRVYLVLSDEERAKGFVRPVRRSYIHVGAPAAQFALRDLTDEEKERFAKYDYVDFEIYPESESPKTGRFWTQNELDNVGRGCNQETTMGTAIAETYARDPEFYGSTYCAHCRMHRPVNEFVWTGTNERVGT